MKKTKTQKLLEQAGKEVKMREPKIVGHTRAKFGEEREQRQKTAIILSKARAQGAKIPKAKKKESYYDYE